MTRKPQQVPAQPSAKSQGSGEERRVLRRVRRPADDAARESTKTNAAKLAADEPKEHPKAARRDIYSRVGRAAPQSIPAGEPRRQEPKRREESEVAPERRPAPEPAPAPAPDPTPSSESETRAFAAASPKREAEPQARRSTEPPAPQPRSAYQDEDFAPATVTGEPTQVMARPQQRGPEPTRAFGRGAAAPSPAFGQAGTAYDGGVGAQRGGASGPEAPNYTDPNLEVAPYEDEYREPARRGTLDFGLLLLRLMLGGYLVATGIATFFQLQNNPGLPGLEQAFGDYASPHLLSVLVPSLMLLGGVFLLLGLISPVATAIALAVTTVMALHQLHKGEGIHFDVFGNEPFIAALLLAGMALVLQFTGPGIISLDAGRGWARRPLASSWIFVVVAIAGAAAIWYLLAGVPPIK